MSDLYMGSIKTVIIDAHAANPGDVSWGGFNELGPVETWARTEPRDVVNRCKDAQVVITNKVIFDRPTIERLPKLRYIGVIATGYNVVDLSFTRERQIVVTNVPAYSSSSVAQFVFAHLFELARHVAHHDRTVRDGRWTASKDFCYWDYPQFDLAGKTMGLVGCGQIGRLVARIASAMDMRVIAFDMSPRPTEGVEFVDLDRVFVESDVASLHCPLTPQTERFINAANLRKMKRSAFLINTSRGPLVNEADLAAALRDGTIAGAGLDVLTVEPPPADNPLLSAPNCFITPHIAWASREARRRLIEITLDNVKAFVAGKPVNVVNGL